MSAPPDAPAGPLGANVSLALRTAAGRHPERCSVRTFGRRSESWSFEQLERRVDSLAHALAALGLRRGERSSLLVPAGPLLIALFHAHLRLGAVPVLIDPGMGRRALLDCIERSAPRALIGVARAHWARRLWPRAFRSVELAASVGRSPAPAARSLAHLEGAGGGRAFEAASVGPDDVAAVLFTSGSTGPAKGVVTTHGQLSAQLAALRSLYGLAPGLIDCACFPLFALFDNALGMTSVFPDMDFTHPARCDPARVHAAIEASGAGFAFASPAVWTRVAAWARTRGARFSRLERVTLAGAPVAPALVGELVALLPPGGRVHTPYGATEALPVSDVDDRELATLRPRIEAGAASCVGRAAPGIELALIGITEEPIERWSEDLRLEPGAPGEVCVKGPVASREYLHDLAATRAAKIPDPAGGVWHRMGDLGQLDDQGRLWILGRKSQRLETARGTLFPVPLENLFDATPGVARSALVGVGPRGAERPHLVVEAARGVRRRELVGALEQRGRLLEESSRVEGYLFRRSLPVDVRHNAKIRREELKLWAEERVGRGRAALSPGSGPAPGRPA